MNVSDVTTPASMGTLATVITSCVLSVVILTTIVGNVFVVTAIALQRNLRRSVANYLIVSLAVADLFVACLVMPLGAMYEITGTWWLGAALCDMWTSVDVLSCTASILHLLAIAIDRYWAVTNINYIQSRDASRVLFMILIVWAVALTISVGPLFGWKDSDFDDRVNIEHACLVSQDVGYQVFATMASFYVPLAAILTLYWRIFQAARRRIRRKLGGASRAAARANVQADTQPVPAIETDETLSTEPQPVAPDAVVEPTQQTTSTVACQLHMATIQEHSWTQQSDAVQQRPPPAAAATRKSRKETLEAKRERKAAKTLAIVTGVFIVCWLPFFVTALVMPLCRHCTMSRAMTSTFLWLGWLNSTLNPIIYTIFSPDFRQAFKKMLCAQTPHTRRNHL